MDLSLQALQTNGKIISNFELVQIICQKPENIQWITRLGLCKRGGGGIWADQHVF